MFRSQRVNIPSNTDRYSFSVDEFKGLDKASGEDNLSATRAVELKNFIRDKVGVVKTRGGFDVVGTGGYQKTPVWLEEWNGYTVRFDGEDVSWLTAENGTLEEKLSIKNEIGNTVKQAVGFAHGEHYYLLIGYSEDQYAVASVSTTLSVSKIDLRILNLEESNNKTVLGGSGVRDIRSCISKYNFIPLPIIVENATPSGGGSLMQSPNLLSPLVQETFTVRESDLVNGACPRFQLSLQDITLLDTNGTVITASEWMTTEVNGKKVWSANTTRTLTSDGAGILQKSIKIEVYKSTSDQDGYKWATVNLSNIFEVGKTSFINPQNGGVWIPSAGIGASPVEGQPNVRITYLRNYNEYVAGLKKLFACTIATKYGVGGYKDRIFLSGSNRIYYSGMDEPLYYGELCYIEPCSEDKSIMAMGGQGQYLYAVDSDGYTHAITGTVTEDDSNTYISDASFIIADRVQGEKPIGSKLELFGDEFCYLTSDGVVAIHHDNYYDKRYAQYRSRMLGDSVKGKIIGGTVWGHYMVLATAEKLYLLDELQQTSLPDYKYSGKQYEVYPFELTLSEVTGGDTEGDTSAFKITHVWTMNDGLYVRVLGNNGDVNNNYGTYLRYDEMKVFDGVAEWITPWISLDNARFKNILEFYLSVGSAGDAVTVEYRTNNKTDWITLRTADGRFIAFDYGKLDYGMFSYNGIVPKLQMILRRRPGKRWRTIQFRFTSAEGYPLSLSNFGFVYEKEQI